MDFRAFPQALSAVVSSDDGGSIFAYSTTHPPEALGSQDYFRSVADRLKRGDVINVVCDHGGELYFGEFSVVSASRQAVHVVNVASLPEVTRGGLVYRTTAGGGEGVKRRGS